MVITRIVTTTAQFPYSQFSPKSLRRSHFANTMTDSKQYTNSASERNRKFHPTESLSSLVVDDIFKAIDQKRLTVMVLIDLSNRLTVYVITTSCSNCNTSVHQFRRLNGLRAISQIANNPPELEFHYQTH